jgi:hypothetical protein
MRTIWKREIQAKLIALRDLQGWIESLSLEGEDKRKGKSIRARTVAFASSVPRPGVPLAGATGSWEMPQPVKK